MIITTKKRKSLNKKAIFWDNDGVLVDTEKYYLEATRRIFAECGFDLTEELFIDNFLKKSSGAWHLLEANGITKPDIDWLRNKRNKLYSYFLANNDIVIDGVEDVIKKMHEKYLMAIVTSSKKEHFNLIHEKTGLQKYFSFVLTREDYKNSKPDPEPYLLAWERSGYKKEECLVIEDSERGLKAAIEAGIDCFVIPTGLTQNSNFTGAKKTLNSASELFDYM